MSRYSRRVFLTAAAGALAAPAFAAKRSATDWVTLGNSGVKVTRLAFGTGTFGGRVQRELGQAEFTRLVRYAYERGIRFFETADSYAGMPIMLANALQGLPRDSYRLMTKYKRSENGDPKLTIDRYRRDLNSEYFDIMLMHGVRNADWTDTYKRVLDQISESKVQKIVHAHGASCHGLQPLRTFPGNKWLDVALLRVNHDGARMDNLRDDVRQKGEVPEVYGHIEKLHGQGTGIIGMKLIGEGSFTDPEQREASLRRVFTMGTVTAATIGFKNTQEIDEAIERIGRALNG